jgi:hypothetical protein
MKTKTPSTATMIFTTGLPFWGGVGAGVGAGGDGAATAGAASAAPHLGQKFRLSSTGEPHFVQNFGMGPPCTSTYRYLQNIGTTPAVSPGCDRRFSPLIERRYRKWMSLYFAILINCSNVLYQKFVEEVPGPVRAV